MHIDTQYKTWKDGDIYEVVAEGRQLPEQDDRPWLMCRVGVAHHRLSPTGSLRVADKPFTGSLQVDVYRLVVDDEVREQPAHGILVHGKDGLQLSSSLAYSHLSRRIIKVLGLLPGTHSNLTVHVGQAPEDGQ